MLKSGLGLTTVSIGYNRCLFRSDNIQFHVENSIETCSFVGSLDIVGLRLNELGEN